MVSTHIRYRNNKDTFLVGLQQSKKKYMFGSSHEDKEDLEVKFARLEQSIAILTDIVMQLSVKDRESSSTRTNHEEYKANQDKSKKLKDLGKNHDHPSSSSLPFKVEAKLEIPMFDGEFNDEVLDS